MYLKTYIKKHLNKNTDFLKKRLVQTKKALSILQETDIKHATYIVNIISLWEGEQSVTTKHKGSIDDAVKAAEKKFKQVNDREDCQAEYDVSIKIGQIEYDLPGKYWTKYKQRSR